MSWRRVRAKGEAPLKPFPKYSSLKVGDTVMTIGGPCALVSIRRNRQVYVNGGVKQRVYWKKGTFLNLSTGATLEIELDDYGVRCEIVRST